MPKNIKYSDLFEDDGGIDKLIQKIKELEATYAKIGKASVKQLNSVKRATENLKTTDKDFNKQIKANEKQVDAVVKKMKEQEKEEKKLNNLRKKAIRLKSDSAKTEQALKLQIQQGTRELKNQIIAENQQKGSLKQLEAQLRRNIEKYRSLSRAERDNTKAGKDLLRNIKKQDVEVKKLNATIGRSQGNVGNYATAFKGLVGVFRNLAGALGITAGLAGLARVVSSSIGIFASYEKQNSKLQAVLGVTKDEMVELTAASKELGATTAFTASEVAGLQTEFAKLGFPTDDILAMTESTLNAAAAMDADLGEAAKLTGATLKSFKLDASEAGRVNDVLAKSTSASALDFQKLSSSMATIAPVANSFGFSLEGTTALLGELSNAGFDASSAATATRKILLNLADANGDLAKSLKEPVTDLPSLVRGLEQLKSEGVDLGKALELTDVKSVAAFSTFLEGTDSILELNEALELSAGTAEEMAAIQLNNLSGAVTILNSAWEGFILSLEDGNGSFATTLKNIVRVLTELLSLASGTEKAREELDEYQEKVRDTARLIIRFSKVITVLVAGFVAYKATLVASRIATSALTFATNIATKSFKAFDKATKANVFGLVASLLATLVSSLYLFRDANDEAAEAQERLNEANERFIKQQGSVDTTFAARLKLSQQGLKSLKNEIEDLIAVEQERIDQAEISTKALKDNLKQSEEVLKSQEALTGGTEELKFAREKFIHQLWESIKVTERELKENSKGNVVRSSDIELRKEQLIEINKLIKANTKLNKKGSGGEKVAGLLKENADALKAAKEALNEATSLGEVREQLELIVELEERRKGILGETREEREKANNELRDETKKLREDEIVAEIEGEEEKSLAKQRIAEADRLRELEAFEGDLELKEKLETEIKEKGERDRQEIKDKFAAEEKKKEDEAEKKRKAQQKETQDAVVNAALDSLDRIQDAEQKRLDDKIDAVDDQISKQEDLAKEGLANTLAFEEGERAKFELKKIESEKKAIRLEKVKALYAAYSAAASSGDDNAIVKVLRDFAIIQGIESGLASFGDGTGEHGDIGDALDARKNGSKGGNSLMNGIFRGESHSKRGHGIPVLVEGNEGILSTSQMGKFGKENFIKLTQGIDSGNIGSDIFERQVAVIPQQSTMMGLNLGSLESKLDGVQKAIEMKPVPNLHAESISDMVSDIVHTVKAGKKTITSRYRINKRGL